MSENKLVWHKSWQRFLSEGVEAYIKFINPSRERELELYKQAVGREIRGIARVISVSPTAAGKIQVEMEKVIPISNSNSVYSEKEVRLARIAIWGRDLGHDSMDELNYSPWGELAEEEFLEVMELLGDIRSASSFFSVSPEDLDVNPGNYGFSFRGNRNQLVFIDFGHGDF